MIPAWRSARRTSSRWPTVRRSERGCATPFMAASRRPAMRSRRLCGQRRRSPGRRWATRPIAPAASASPICWRCCIARDGVVGLFQGRAETGPRALGHRSILANPTNPRTLETINRLVKFREPFRPLAPMLTLEAAHRWFELQEGASDDDYNAYNYMVLTVRARPDSSRRIPAVIHRDGTSRIQIVREDTDPFTHAYLRAMGRRCGVEASVNTSLNVAGPIVQTPQQALEALRRSKAMDGVLLIGAEGDAWLAWHAVAIPPKDGGRRLGEWLREWKTLSTLPAFAGRRSNGRAAIQNLLSAESGGLSREADRREGPNPAACPCRRTATAAPIAARPGAGSASAPTCGLLAHAARPSSARRPARSTSPCCTSTITSPAFSPRSAAELFGDDIGDHHALLVGAELRTCPSVSWRDRRELQAEPGRSRVGFCAGRLVAGVGRRPACSSSGFSSSMACTVTSLPSRHSTTGT